jgi:hypothetical protein
MKRALAGLGLALSLLRPAQGCGYHGTAPDLRAAHPRSLDIAFALADAHASGQLQVLQPLPPALALMRVGKLLRDIGPQLPTPGLPGMGERLAVLLVEPGLWARYEWRGDRWELADVDVPGPDAADSVLITSEAALAAMQRREFGFDGALALGLALRPADTTLALGQQLR